MADLKSNLNHRENEVQSDDDNDVIVLFVPFAAQGHMTPLLQFAILVASYRIPVYFVQSEIHNRQAKSRSPTSSDISKVRFHDLPMPPFESPAPNPSSTSKIPEHKLAMYKAIMDLRRPFFDYLSQVSSTAKRVVVVHDNLISLVVQDAASLPNVLTYTYQVSCAYSSLAYKRAGLLQNDDDAGSRFENMCNALMSETREGVIYNTCRVLEDKFIDQIATDFEKKKIWAIGNLHGLASDKKSKNSDNNNNNNRRRDKCLEWLDNQAPKSVVYIAFGTTVSMEDKQIKEMALGLEQSGHKFLWVLRDADKGNVFDGEETKSEVIKGFEERVAEEGKGMVVREWAPQLEILAHPSIGGFFCHGGWNSCLESLCNGVPLLAWPKHFDQPLIAKLFVDELGVCMLIKETTSHVELLESSAVSEGIKRLMDSKGGGEMRGRVERMGVAIRRSIGEGGDSRKELDEFITQITS